VVTLQSAIAAELPFLRAQAQARMLSRATVRRAGGTTTVDGFEVPGWTDVHTDLPFRLGGTSGAGSTRTVRIGETEAQVAVRIGHFPAGTTGLADNDFIEITDGENAGGVYRIVEASGQDQATARRVPVVEEQRPEEWA